MAHRRVGAVLVTAFMTVLAMSGCLERGSSLQPTETIAEAAERVEELLREAIAQLPSDATVDLHLSSVGAPCDLSGGPVFSEQTADIFPPASGTWSATDVLPILSDFWERKGYRVTTDDNSRNRHRYFVRTDDEYKVFVYIYDRGGHYDAHLGASSPCVWEFGTPGPQ